MQEDLTQRDLSGKRVQDMTPAERLEMKRRFEEFVQTMRKTGPAADKAPAKPVQRWDPRSFGAKTVTGRRAG